MAAACAPMDTRTPRMEHAEAKTVVREQVDEWLALFDDDMRPKKGAVIPPHVSRPSPRVSILFFKNIVL